MTSRPENIIFYKIYARETLKLPARARQPKAGFSKLEDAARKLFEITNGQFKEAVVRYSIRELVRRPIETWELGFIHYHVLGPEIPLEEWKRYFIPPRPNYIQQTLGSWMRSMKSWRTLQCMPL